MPDHWTPEEDAATVADYLAMLQCELRGEPYVKAKHNRNLRALLNNRSHGAVEFKYQNISAVMIELGFPYIDGYKPRGNYQEYLRTEVQNQLSTDRNITRITQEIVDAPASKVAARDKDVFVDPPTRDRPRAVYERRKVPTARRVNYLEQEARNRSLGTAGEVFAAEVEHRRLWTAGKRDLANRVEHVAATRGDGLGYDVLSFEVSGRERFIEVKTTAFGSMTPFFASAAEVRASEELDTYHLYRVFKSREAPRIFTLPGSLRQSCVLEAVQFRASLP